MVKSVLSAIPTHFITAIKPSKWFITGVDKYRRSFLWRGKDQDQVRGGQCLVNWKTWLRPKKWGGLGIKYIDKFSRALRLIWLWNSWDKQNRQWKNLVKMHDHVDRALFFSSTYIVIGDGKNTPFWKAKWLNGAAPKDIAPSLFREARCKRRMVSVELHNLN
jgi:hypothetical protein